MSAEPALPTKFQFTFWGVYMAVNGLVILAYLAVLVWAAFDIHSRLDYVLLGQIPPIVMMGIRRIFRD